MSTLKSSTEDLTLNADGSGNDVIIQSDGSTKAIITAEGNIGIGDTDPSEAKLSIDNVASGDIGLQIVNAQATKGLYIDQNGDGDALNIDSEATSNAAARINGKYPLIATQDISSGYAGYFTRNIDEAGSNPLVQIIDDHTSNTQAALKIQQDGTGYGIECYGSGGVALNHQGAGQMTLADDAIYTCGAWPNTAVLVNVSCKHQATGAVTWPGGSFYVTYADNNSAMMANIFSSFADIDTDGYMCCYSGNNSATVYVKNRLGVETKVAIQATSYGQ